MNWKLIAEIPPPLADPFDIVLWRQCESWASGLEMTSLLRASRLRADFPKAWTAYRTAMDNWLTEVTMARKDFAALYGDVVGNDKRELKLDFERLRQATFLSSLRFDVEKKNNVEWSKAYSQTISFAEQARDAQFFCRLSEAKAGGDCRDYRYIVLAYWISACLWRRKWRDGAEYIARQSIMRDSNGWEEYLRKALEPARADGDDQKTVKVSDPSEAKSDLARRRVTDLAATRERAQSQAEQLRAACGRLGLWHSGEPGRPRKT